MTPHNSKNRRWLASIVVIGLLLTSCSGSSETTKIAIVNTLSSLDPIVQAFEADLIAGLDSEVEFVSINSVAASFEAGIDDLLATHPDLVVTLNTPNSLMVGQKLEGTAIPQIFGMVTDPVGSALVADVSNPGRNRTGVGLFHIEYTLGLAVQATGAQRVGILHQPSDAASVSGLALAQKSAEFLGVDLVVIEVDDDVNLDGVMTSIPSTGIDLFFLVGSPFTARNIGRISLITRTWSFPSVSSLTVDALPAGFMIGVAPDSSDIGEQMAERALAVLHGGSAGDIPVGVAQNVAILDLALARHYGITVPDEALASFDEVTGGS